MLSSIEERLSTLTDSESQHTHEEITSWIETTVLVLTGVSGLLATYLHVLTSHSSFIGCWRTLLGHFKSLLKYDILNISTAVFKALAEILSNANTKAESEAKLERHSERLSLGALVTRASAGIDQIASFKVKQSELSNIIHFILTGALSFDEG